MEPESLFEQAASAPKKSSRPLCLHLGSQLASVRLEPSAAWSLLVGAGSGLPLSRAAAPGAASESVLAVTSPAFRAVATARYTLPSVL